MRIVSAANFRITASALAAAALAIGVGAAPASAADGVREGVKVAGPDGACSNAQASNTYVTVCYQANGDYLYVKDGEADGKSAYGYFTWPGDKDHCRNSYGAGTWVRCNYDLPEDMRIMYEGYTQDNEGFFNPKGNWTGEANEWS
jgi:hypothetical protein